MQNLKTIFYRQIQDNRREKMLYNCKGVIFDFNGTLFFDSDKHVLAWGRMAEKHVGKNGVKSIIKDFTELDI